MDKRPNITRVSKNGLAEICRKANFKCGFAIGFTHAAEIIQIGHHGITRANQRNIALADPRGLLVRLNAIINCDIERKQSVEASLAAQCFQVLPMLNSVKAKYIEAGEINARTFHTMVLSSRLLKSAPS